MTARWVKVQRSFYRPTVMKHASLCRIVKHFSLNFTAALRNLYALYSFQSITAKLLFVSPQICCTPQGTVADQSF